MAFTLYAPNGSAVSAGGVTIASYGRPQVPVGGPTFSASQWSAVDEGSAAANGIAQIDFTELPTRDGWEADSFLIESDDGATAITHFVHWGAELNKTRRISLSIGTFYSLRVRIRWRKLNTNLADLFEFELSDWSSTKAVTPTAVANPTVTIAPLRTDQRTAPVGCMYEVDISGFGVIRPNHDLKIDWDYGDPGSTHKRLRSEFVAVQGNDANTSDGFLGIHTFEDHGTHTVTCTVTDGAITQSGTYSEVVLDPEVTYAGDKTCYIRTNGDFSDISAQVAAGAKTATTFALAKAQYGNNDSVRYLFYRGDDFSLAAGATNELRHADFQLGLYGPEAGDTLFPSLEIELPQNGVLSQGDRSIWGGEFVGEYDPADPQPGYVRANGIRVVTDGLTLHDCGFKGHNQCIQIGFKRNYVVSSCHISDWADYGLFNSEGRMHGFVGTTMAQNPLTIRANGKSEGAPVYADHGPYRCSSPEEPVAFSKCDIYSSNTWIGAEKTVQLCVRWNAGSTPAQQLMFSQCMTEGSTLLIGGTVTPNASAPVDAVVSKNHHTGNLGSLVATNSSGVSFYNNIGVLRGGSAEGDDLKSGFIAGQSYSDTVFTKWFPDRFNAHENPIRFWHNTIIDLRTDNETKDADGTGDAQVFARSYNTVDLNLTNAGFAETVRFSDISEEANAFYVPNRTGGPNDGPFDLTALGSGRYAGRLFLGENSEILDPQFANTGTVLVPVPQAGSPVIDDVARFLVDDFNGTTRTATTERGALVAA